MTSFMMIFNIWKELMSSNNSNVTVYNSLFWDYLNYSYLKDQSNLKDTWTWND